MQLSPARAATSWRTRSCCRRSTRRRRRARASPSRSRSRPSCRRVWSRRGAPTCRWHSSPPGREWTSHRHDSSYELANTYRETHHLDSYILLTSKHKVPRLVGRYCSYLLPTQALSTFNLMSTEHRNQGAVSPCTSRQGWGRYF